MGHNATVLTDSPLAANVGVAMVKIAAIYMLIGLIVGMAMGISGDFSLSSVHAHISLLGWATMSITGMIYLVMPGCRKSRLAGLHFWGHNVGLPVMMLGLASLTYGLKDAEKTVAGGSVIVLGSLLAFTVNVWRNGVRAHLNDVSIAIPSTLARCGVGIAQEAGRFSPQA